MVKEKHSLHWVKNKYVKKIKMLYRYFGFVTGIFLISDIYDINIAINTLKTVLEKYKRTIQITAPNKIILSNNTLFFIGHINPWHKGWISWYSSPFDLLENGRFKFIKNKNKILIYYTFSTKYLLKITAFLYSIAVIFLLLTTNMSDWAKWILSFTILTLLMLKMTYILSHSAIKLFLRKVYYKPSKIDKLIF